MLNPSSTCVLPAASGAVGGTGVGSTEGGGGVLEPSNRPATLKPRSGKDQEGWRTSIRSSAVHA